jgi:ParB-like chromosome segregation protein Spo0J
MEEIVEIQKINIELIKEADFNPRKIDEKNYKDLKESINKLGYIQPIIWNKITGRIVSGHQRFKILKEKGMKELEVVIVNLNENEEKATIIALNKISGEWDYDLLNGLLIDLKQNDLLDLTGFTQLDLDMLKGFEENGAVMEEGLLTPTQTFQLTFKFDDEIEFKKARAFFNKKSNKELNTKLLSKLVNENEK